MITGKKLLLASCEPESQRWKTSVRHFPAEQRFCIVLKETEEIVGQLNYCGYNRKEREVEIGIEIDYANRGKGYGEDALYHFLQYLFTEMKVKCVKLAVLLSNTPARHLYQKLGFGEKQVVLRGGYDVEAESFMDIVIMELARECWLTVCQDYTFKR